MTSSSSSVASAPVVPVVPAFQLVKATYGAGAGIIDVTSKISAILDSDGNFKSQLGNYNAFFGTDPAGGLVKTLTIVYSRSGTQKTATFTENTQSISLP